MVRKTKYSPFPLTLILFDITKQMGGKICSEHFVVTRDYIYGESLYELTFITQYLSNFDVMLTVRLSIILVIDELNAQNLVL